MEKLHSEALNIAEAQMKLLRELFPECVTEGPDGLAVDFDALRQALSSQVVEGPQERYRLDWPGKRGSRHGQSANRQNAASGSRRKH